jgi:hypothetical protein
MNYVLSFFLLFVFFTVTGIFVYKGIRKKSRKEVTTPSPANGPRRCSQCGAGLAENDRFCGECGSPV